MQYIANKSRFIIKAVGDFDFSRTDLTDTPGENLIWDDEITRSGSIAEDSIIKINEDNDQDDMVGEEIDIAAYRPTVIDRQWRLSEIDLQWITTGCYILGTGGGGNPYQHMLNLRGILRRGGVVNIISPMDLKDDDIVACGGSKGSPQVSVEKPYGDE
jgi:hypothetical protein